MIGQTLAHYRVTAALGAGGMGQVYRATDTKLNREVAIKVLPPEVARDPERLGRFEREAHLLAALNHPNIAAIYGLEEADGRSFLVLELVDGEDLRERLARGTIPVDEALEIARQVAEGLGEAHAKGIVHRDLKPANVKLTADGKVKVLDFGLAKAWSGDGGRGGSSPSASMSQSPTLAPSGTQAGVILGTAAYMSPEQARGKAVDKRGDIWAFGALLWEMLTGHALFAGDGVTETLAAVMRDDPDWSRLPGSTPHSVRRLLRRCLQKDPRERLHDIADARLELGDALVGPAEGFEAGQSAKAEAIAPQQPHAARQKWVWAAAGFLTAGLVFASTIALLTKDSEPRAVVRFAFDAPEALPAPPAVSPDGRHVVFVGKGHQLWIRSLASADARPLPGTEGAYQPFWSPDGTWIAFFSEPDLSRISLDGGSIHRICALRKGVGADVVGGTITGGTWGDDDTIVLANGGNLFTVAAGGGEAALLTQHDESRRETRHSWPRFLPDGRRLLFVVDSPEDDSAGLHVTSLDAPHERRRLLPGSGGAAYASGSLLFVRNGTLHAQHFDSESLVVSGEPAPVARDVDFLPGLPDRGLFGVSANGVLAYRERRLSDVRLVWRDREGGRLGTVGEPGPYGQVALSPDGRHVALEILNEMGGDIWVMDVTRGVTSHVTGDLGYKTNPVWSPDSQELVFAAGDDVDIHRRRLQGGASAMPLLDTAERTWPEDWSRDGETLLYGTVDALWALPLAGGPAARLVSEATAQLAEPRLSPDGRWLAYISDESGSWEVYVEPFGRPGERVRVSVDGGGQPKWRGDGRELFYIAFPSHKLMAVEVRPGAERIDVGLPGELFDVDVVGLPRSDNYGVTSDGQRFLVMVPVEAPAEPRIHIVTQWPALLEGQ